MARVLAILLALAVVGCEQENQDATPIVHQELVPELRAYAAPNAIKLKESPTHALQLSNPQRLLDCHMYLEPNGKVVREFPWSDNERFEALVGCQAEAWLRHENALYVAYAVPTEGGRSDLRFAKFEGRKYVWSLKIDRSQQGTNFIANYRSGFITRIDDKHVCAGTLWEGGTTTTCVDPKEGKQQWGGRLSFWAGLQPTGRGDAFYVADLASLTKRYPFSGVEMRHQKLDGTGGRAAFYASDGRSLYFAPSRAEQPRMIRYDFDSMDPVWRSQLADNTFPGFSPVFDAHDVVVVKQGSEILALDTEDGHYLWRLEVGEDRPSLAATGKEILILHRVPDVPNHIIGVDPKTGAINWQSTVPVGTLKVVAEGDQVVFMGVRSTQLLTGLDPI